MNRNHSHDMDALGHALGVGLAMFFALMLAGMALLLAFEQRQNNKNQTGLVPKDCPSGKVTIEIRMNGKLFQSFERNSLQAFDFKVPAAATVIITPEKVYY